MPPRTTPTPKPRTKLRISDTPPPTPAPSQKEQTSMATVVNHEDRHQMIRETAYYLAEKDGFPSGKDEEYWSRAEEQIDKMLKA